MQPEDTRPTRIDTADVVKLVQGGERVQRADHAVRASVQEFTAAVSAQAVALHVINERYALGPHDMIDLKTGDIRRKSTDDPAPAAVPQRDPQPLQLSHPRGRKR